MFTSYPNFLEDSDYRDVISEADRKRMKEELDLQYRIRRDQMFKQMQLAFRQKQLELERRFPKDKQKRKKSSKRYKEKREKTAMWRYGDSFDTSSEEEGSSDDDDESDDEREDDWKKAVNSPWNHNLNFDELRAARAKVDVVICTTDHGEISLQGITRAIIDSKDWDPPFAVPGYRIVEKLGTFKVVVPRS